MIVDKSSFKHTGLAKLWMNRHSKPPELDSTLIKRAALVLSHLESAASSKDIATGLGETRNFHKLKPLSDDRYSLDVNGPIRITFRLVDASTGEVTDIDLENTHRT